MTQDRTQTLARLNDEFRRVAVAAALGEAAPEQVPGRLVITRGVAALPVPEQVEVLQRVKLYEDFSAVNDPYGEHDFGVIPYAGETFYWKIDYYDPTLTAGSDDPTDPDQTTRVMTVLCAYEY